MSSTASLYRDISEFLRYAGLDSIPDARLGQLLSEASTMSSISQPQLQKAVQLLSRAAARPQLLQKKLEDLRKKPSGSHLERFIVVFARHTARQRQRASVSTSVGEISNYSLPTDSVTTATAESFSTSNRIAQELKQALCEATYTPPRSLREAIITANGLDERVLPAVPDWLTDNTCHVTPARPTIQHTATSLGALPWDSQERVVIQELLSCLQGNSGDHLHITDSSIDVDLSLHPSLQEVVRQVSPLVLAYVRVAAFVDESSFLPSQVLQALGATLRNIQREHEVLVAQLETQLLRHSLSIHTLWLYLQPSLKSMTLVASIIDKIRSDGLSSGQTLSLLSETQACGDESSEKLCNLLLEHAAAPYLKILSTWLNQGVVSDPYLEFMVKDNGVGRRKVSRSASGNTSAFVSSSLPTLDALGGCSGSVDYDVGSVDGVDDFWQKRYSVLVDKTPGFLKPQADTILRAGKYLNVLKHCGSFKEKEFAAGSGDTGEGDTELAVESPVADSPGDDGDIGLVTEKNYMSVIKRSYQHASRQLLRQLMDDSDLVGRLRSMKHYYLLDRGDFVLQLISLCESELVKSIDDVVPTRLQNLLELALRTSSANTDPYKDDLRPDLLGYDLKFQMTRIHSIETVEEQKWLPPERLSISGFEAFTFTTCVAWPVSLVIDRKSIACYQMIFRLLFQCKLLETQLCRVWAKSACDPAGLGVPVHCRLTANTLCQRMLASMQKLIYYMSSQVLEPSWRSFLHNIAQVSTFDDVLRLHSTLLDECMRDCMLKHLPLLTALNGLLSVCRQFINFIDGGCVVTGEAGGEVSTTLARLDSAFCDSLLQLIERVADHHRRNFADRLVGLISRLDYNGYYANLLEKRVRKRVSEVC